MTTADICVWTFVGVALAFVGMAVKIYSLCQERDVWKGAERQTAEQLRKLQLQYDQLGKELGSCRRVLEKRDQKLALIKERAGILDKAIVEFFETVAEE